MVTWISLSLAALICSDFIQAARASCPSLCNGHGRCDSMGKCICFSGWGAAADCSLRTCPSGPSWADIASADDSAHADAECSDRGYCDRLTGKCRCLLGFRGPSCSRSECPGTPIGCSGHGQCLSMRAHARRGDQLRHQVVLEYADPWDADMIYGCSCDDGWGGPDCS